MPELRDSPQSGTEVVCRSKGTVTEDTGSHVRPAPTFYHPWLLDLSTMTCCVPLSVLQAPAPAPPSSVTTAAAAAPPLPNPLTERMLAEARTAAHAFSANLAYAVKFMSARALTVSCLS